MGRYLVLKRAIRFVSVVRLRKQREDETIYRITEHRPGVYPESKRSPSTFPRAPANFKGEIPRHRKVGIAQRALNETATYFIRPRDFPFPLLSRVVRFFSHPRTSPLLSSFYQFLRFINIPGETIVCSNILPNSEAFDRLKIKPADQTNDRSTIFWIFLGYLASNRPHSAKLIVAS